MNNLFYQAMNQTLTIFSINYTTTVQCAVHILVSPPIVLTSGTATVTVVGMYKRIYEYIYAHNADVSIYILVYTYICICSYDCSHRYTHIYNVQYHKQ